VKDLDLIKFRTYFIRKVVGAQTAREYQLSLRGASLLNEYPFVKLSDDSSSIIKLQNASKQQAIKYEITDILGIPIAEGIKSVKVTLFSPLNSAIDANKHVKLSKNNN
jgi:hypothetical protein